MKPWEEYQAAAESAPWLEYGPAPEAPEPTAAGQAARLAGIAGSAALKGVTAIAGLPGDLQTGIQMLTRKYLYEPAFRAVTGRPSAGESMTPEQLAAVDKGFLSSETIQAPLRGAGLIDNPALAPTTRGERYTAAAGEAVGAGLPFAGGLGLMRTVASSIGAGTAGEFATELLPKHPMAARIAGSIAGGVVGSAIYGAGQSALGLVRGEASPIALAYREAGVEPAAASDLMKSKTARGFVAYLSKAPGSADDIQGGIQASVDDWARSLEVQAEKFGAATSPQEAGGILQSTAKTWVANWKDAQTLAWGAFRKLLPPDLPIPVDNTRAMLTGLAKSMDDAPELAKALQSAGMKKLADALGADATAGTLKAATVQRFRSEIGAKIGDPKLVGDIGYGELKQVYAALSDDIGAAAARAGPGAEAAFNSANALTRGGHRFVEETISKFTAKGVTPEGAYDAAFQGVRRGATGVTGVARLFKEVDAELLGELSAAKLREMARALPGQQNAAGTAASPTKFLTEWSRMAPDAKAVLFADPRFGNAAQKLDRLVEVADSMKETIRLTNTSNTGPFVQWANILGAGGGALTGQMITGDVVGAGTGLAIGALTLPAINYASAKIMQNAAVIALAGAKKIPVKALADGILAARLAPAYSAFVNRQEEEPPQ